MLRMSSQSVIKFSEDVIGISISVSIAVTKTFFQVLRQMPFLTQPSHFTRTWADAACSGWVVCGLAIHQQWGWILDLQIPN